jgi:AAA family ATP:ADP antiporter
MPLLAVVRVAKIIENSADYSLQNTARHALFLNTSREAKYKAKAAIDTFFWRAGDVAQAGLVLLGSQLGLSITQYARINALMVAVWIGVVALLYREGRRRKASSVAYPAPAEARKAG